MLLLKAWILHHQASTAASTHSQASGGRGRGLVGSVSLYVESRTQYISDHHHGQTECVTRSKNHLGEPRIWESRKWHSISAWQQDGILCSPEGCPDSGDIPPLTVLPPLLPRALVHAREHAQARTGAPFWLAGSRSVLSGETVRGNTAGPVSVGGWVANGQKEKR